MVFKGPNEADRANLKSIYETILGNIYPEKYQRRKFDDKQASTIRKIRNHIWEQPPTSLGWLELLNDDEIADSKVKKEYEIFRKFWSENYLMEFLYIGSLITPFNTMEHVCGVHSVAMHVAKQLKQAGFPVDLALVSATAACHDLGKYGCTGAELERVPYLHYYYTEELLKRCGMPLMAKIAGNHSVWDLERDMLSAEWMILIYSDFRVKSSRDERGREHINFYSLDGAFDVILNKLDDLDDAKKERYKKAYARLKRFEDYMIFLGVDPEIGGQWKETEKLPDEAHKYVMIDYELRLASGFNYLTQAKMDRLLEHLAAKIKSGSGEVRKQALMMLKEIIRNYDPVYNKELPANVVLTEPAVNSADLKVRYKEILEYD